MRTIFTLILALATALPPVRAASDAAVAPVAESDDIFPAQPGEPVLFPQLRGVRFIAEPAQLTAPGFPAAGVDASLVPSLDPADAAVAMSPFMDFPASEASLQRLTDVLRAYLRVSGRPFSSVYLPPQDVTDGYVQVVVAESRSDGEVTVAGAKWFSAGAYQAHLRQRADAPIDAAQLNADVAWLNRNPYRRASIAAESGRTPGTTRLSLRTDERLPLSLNAGYSNTGTALTDEDRVSAGVTWGNAFGRGDLLNLGASGDPAWEHVRSYNAGYTAFLPWRHVLNLQGAWSTMDSVMPEPFTQSGTSWQVGARYEIPLAAPRQGWTQTLSLMADFKYSDNTLEFAEIPVTDNITHVAQIGASYGLTFPALGGQNSARLELAASPGGLTDYNDDTAFAGSRLGAKAAYAFTRLGLRHQRPLAAEWTLVLSADAQLSTGALLGSEQLNGGGAYAVRGYRESSAFGDWGVVGSAELHAPGFAVARGRADLFVFLDGASLRLHEADAGTDLASAGLGVNCQLGRYLSLRGAYGWQLQAIDSSRGVYSGRGHVSAHLSW